MIKKIICLTCVVLMIFPLTASKLFTVKDTRSIILTNDYTSAERNSLLIKDVEYFGKYLAQNHKNPFTKISQKDFDEKISLLKSKVNKLTNIQVFVEMNKLTASIGDAHTGINYWDGYSYPIAVEFFGDDLYVINTDKSLKETLYTKVISINGHAVSYICEQLKSIIAHENDNWVKAMLPQYITAPVYMYGLGLIPDEKSTKFTFEKDNGDVIERELTTLSFGVYPDYCVSYDTERNVYLYDNKNEDNYWYKYLENEKSVYFKYNSCAEMKSKPFTSFNKNMFADVSGKTINNFIIDLRHNTGGNSNVILPFVKSLSDLSAKKTDMKVFIITGRHTFSSGMMAVDQIRNAVPSTIVGEATGGSPNSFGEVKTFSLPGSKIPVSYSVKYFQGTDTKANTITPDKEILPTINDFKSNVDVVMKYILSKK